MNPLEILIKWIEENPYEKRMNILRKAVEINEITKNIDDMKVSEHHPFGSMQNMEYISGGQRMYDYPFTVKDFDYKSTITR